MEYTHKPVLLHECLTALQIKPNGIYIDGTLGRAGHSIEIAQRLTTGRLVCIDRDLAAIDAARERLAPWMDRVTLAHRNFSELEEVLKEAHVSGADGMLFDLGVSSPQLDDPSRGFSYMHDAPLDMRMDETQPLTAREIVNAWNGDELRRILYEYGEERYAPRIVNAILSRREEAPIETTLQLVDVIKSAMPAAALREKQHPAKRSFQAIRIAVNGELDALSPMLEAAVNGLNPGGRLAVITFQSLEDRIVKQTYKRLATGCTCPPEFPVCVCGKKPKIKLITRKPIESGEAELNENPRARSAKLRVAEKVDTFDI
ncbi:MAG: 16S rRNA (cytosine(1402)-N(4))-methyltransferase RsmH [Oscillibacter sp.]|jgi:16S rRNA (cytosine1402-N4)-methyltransferase|nr:16S rRNA (cytosine(1402)-N(4))-methyltransferase RsmH [Oscillibacter sp.]